MRYKSQKSQRIFIKRHRTDVKTCQLGSGLTMMTEDATARMQGSENDLHRRRNRTPVPKLNTFAACLDNAFDDKRVTIACISVWFMVCLIGFTSLGIFGSEYMRVGPSDTLTYMGMKIQTMTRYMTVVVFVVISTAVNDFASDAISPWIQNTVMDHKTRTIPYSKFTIVFITQTWALYCGTMSVASIALVFAQFDLIMIRLVVDLFVNQYTIRRFLVNKTHDPYRYHTEFLNEDDTDPLTENTYDTNQLTENIDHIISGGNMMSSAPDIECAMPTSIQSDEPGIASRALSSEQEDSVVYSVPYMKTSSEVNDTKKPSRKQRP